MNLTRLPHRTQGAAQPQPASGTVQTQSARVHSRRATGFTLIELMLVVSLLGILATVSILRFAGPYRQMRFETDCEQLKNLDATVRRECIRSSRGAIIQIDLNYGDWVWRGADRENNAGGSLHLQEAVVAKVATARRQISGGQVAFAVSAEGGSQTYAVQLTSGSKQRWIVFLGGTGQTVEGLDDGGVREILRWHRMQGADAD